jgi:hypothetical protein
MHAVLGQALDAGVLIVQQVADYWYGGAWTSTPDGPEGAQETRQRCPHLFPRMRGAHISISVEPPI